MNREGRSVVTGTPVIDSPPRTLVSPSPYVKLNGAILQYLHALECQHGLRIHSPAGKIQAGSPTAGAGTMGDGGMRLCTISKRLRAGGLRGGRRCAGERHMS